MEDGIEQFMIRTIADIRTHIPEKTVTSTVVPTETNETQFSKLPTVNKTALKIKKD
jgi:hypothetical protein